ncbi:hypothetical protein Golob_010401 [Gossypium lobatum]|uniref:Uncharacterized protein n=1 Tax=Gossypium lobatum TaxID=34289 RepID=A0A7J8MLR2_9ROSI|nr:hypothetical protein [Gossypium lobatum]
MGSNDRNFDAGSCNVSDKVDLGAEKNITCTCQNDTCHVTHIIFKHQNLPGVLPPELVNLPYLKVIDLEANQFSGQVPPEIGKLVNLRTLRLSYNRLTGDLPVQLAELKNLTDFSGFTKEGKKLHGNILKMSFSSEHVLSEKLMDTYIALGDLNGVIKVFDAMPKWNVFSWNKMISAS